jgi:hypothetical protein
MLDAEALAEAHAALVREFVEHSMAPVLRRLAALEARSPEKGEPGKDAESAFAKATADMPALVKQLVDDAVSAIALPPAPAAIEPDMDAIGEMVAREVHTAVAALPLPKDGESVTVEDVRPLIDEALGAAVAMLPVPKDGADAESAFAKATADMPALVKQMVDEAIAEIPPVEAPPAIEPDMAAIGETIAAEVERAVAAIPPPRDGTSVTAEELRPLVDDAVGKAVAALPVPKDGVGVAGAVIDRDGGLVLTLSDGAVRELGSVVGKDADMASIEARLRDLVAALPPAKDGVDGVGFDDLEFEHDGGRNFALRFVRGDVVKAFPFTVPIVLDAGVFKEGTTYDAGDGVTWSGSYWIAQKETGAKPDSGDGSWRLSVKRGRDAKPAEPVQLQP